MVKQLIKYFFLIFLLICFLISCKQKNENKILKINKSYNSDALECIDTLVLEENRNVILQEPFTILAKDNNYYVYSNMDAIYKYDNNGKFLKKIGNKGQGPGEYEFLSKIFNVDKNIGVYDILLNRITIFDEEDNLERVVSLKRSIFTYSKDVIYHKNFFYFLVPYASDYQKHVLKVNYQGEIVDKIIAADKKYADYSPLGAFSGNIIIDSLNNDLYYAGAFTDNCLIKYNFKTKKEFIISLPKPKYFLSPEIPQKNTTREEKMKMFTRGNSLRNLYRLNKNHLLIEYTEFLQYPYIKSHSMIYNLKSKKINYISNTRFQKISNNYIYNWGTAYTKDNKEIFTYLEKYKLKIQ